MPASTPAWAFLASFLASSFLASSFATTATASSSSVFEAHAYVPEYRDASRAALACAHARGRARVRVLAFSAEFTADGRVRDVGRALATKRSAFRGAAADANARGDASSASASASASACAFDLVIGGGGRSDAFSAALSTARGVERAAREAVREVKARAYDGASFDWEYPRDASEWASYAALLCATKRAFGDDAHRVSFSLHPSADTFKYVKQFRMLDCADTAYVMAYDFSPTNERPNDGHSALGAVIGLLKYINASNVVEDASKLMLGIPFYGRRVSDFGDAKTYEELVRAMGDAFEPTRAFVDGVVFNSVEIVRAKVREAKKFGFGGVMVWELGQDVPIDQEGVSLFDAILDEAAKLDDDGVDYASRHEDL